MCLSKESRLSRAGGLRMFRVIAIAGSLAVVFVSVFGAGCTRIQSGDAVSTSLPPWSSFRSGAEEEYAFMADVALAGSTRNRKHGESTTIIAWCVKLFQDIEPPPSVLDEAIILVSWKTKSDETVYSLAHLSRGLSAGLVTTNWRQGSGADTSYREYAAPPTEDQVAAFIASTSFGYNQKLADMEVLRILLFIESRMLANQLRTQGQT